MMGKSNFHIKVVTGLSNMLSHAHIQDVIDTLIEYAWDYSQNYSYIRH